MRLSLKTVALLREFTASQRHLKVKDREYVYKIVESEIQKALTSRMKNADPGIQSSSPTV